MIRHVSSVQGVDVRLLSQITGTIANSPIDQQQTAAAISRQAMKVARLFESFVDAATRTLDVCIYDFRLTLPAVSSVVVDAVNRAADRGVAVRIAYDKNQQDDTEIMKKFRGAGGDPAPTGTSAFLTAAPLHAGVQVLPVAEEAVVAGSQIMHHKYMIRDVAKPSAAVWMGSTNFTVDAWAVQENNIVVLASPGLAAAYGQDFTDLWTTGALTKTGKGDTGTTKVGSTNVSYAFAPGEGSTIETMIADTISGASKRLRIASMVLSSPAILTAIKSRIDAGVPVVGVYDKDETLQVRSAWSKYPKDADKIVLLDAVLTHLVPKKSLPFQQNAPGNAHNFMHNKIAVADDTVATGSFNFSTNATHNAENVIVLTEPALAGAYSAYVQELVHRYSTT